jgi:hypothetical protein
VTSKDFLTLLDPPNGPTSRNFCVDVRLATGLYYLNVLGVTAAVEGDHCRDCTLDGPVWTKELLEQAAKRIRKRLVFMLTSLDMLPLEDL